MHSLQYLTLPDRRLAYQRVAASLPGPAPGLVFLSGFGSDMTGSKAEFLAQQAARHNRALLRFDYRGHGQSDGKFADGCIGDWLDDAVAVFDQLTTGAQILVGSSMGGWLALLLARLRPERVAGIVGIAAAPDFTEVLVRANLNSRQQAELTATGATYDEAAPPDFRLPYTQKLLDEGRDHLLLDAKIQLSCPVHLLQGMEDPAVPWQHALKIVERLESPSVKLTLIKDGEHRLSRDQDLASLWQAVEGLPL